MKLFSSNSVAPDFPSSRPSLLERNSSDIQPSLSESQGQVEACVEGFVRQATDGHALAAVAAGGMAYRVGRIGVMGLGSGHALRFASVGLGLAAEVSAFEVTNRGLHPENLNVWKWSGPGGLREGLLSSLVTFGTLKGFGRLTQGENLILQHGSQATGMVLGHQLAYRAGSGSKPVGTLAAQFLHAEATNLQLGAGMALSHAFTRGHLHGIERGLDLALSPRGIPRVPRFSPAEERNPSSTLAMATVGVEKGELFPSQLWMEGDENGGGAAESPIRIDEVWLRGIDEGYPRLGKELERMLVSPNEKAELLKRLVKTVQNDAQYVSENALGTGRDYQDELEQGTALALNGLTAALRILRKIDWTPQEKWNLLRLLAESDKKFPELTFVGEAYRALPKIFMAMKEAGWDPSVHRLFLERVVREAAPLVVKALPLAIRGLHRLGWTYEEQSNLYFSWAERSGHGTDEILHLIV